MRFQRADQICAQQKDISSRILNLPEDIRLDEDEAQRIKAAIDVAYKSSTKKFIIFPSSKLRKKNGEELLNLGYYIIEFASFTIISWEKLSFMSNKRKSFSQFSDDEKQQLFDCLNWHQSF